MNQSSPATSLWPHAYRRIQALMEEADVRIGGDRPWDVAIHDDRFFAHVLSHGSLGAGEAYMDGWWDCPQLDELCARVLRVQFPNSVLPSAKQIATAAEGLFVLEDWHAFGQHYDRTLMAWHANFNEAWSEFKAHYDERFYRMWTFYLLTSAGSFRARSNQLWQVLFSSSGIEGSYEVPR